MRNGEISDSSFLYSQGDSLLESMEWTKYDPGKPKTANKPDSARSDGDTSGQRSTESILKVIRKSTPDLRKSFSRGRDWSRMGSGVILSVRDFPGCVHFYRDRIGLDVLMEKPGIAQFRLGTLYLQIEDGRKMNLGPTRNVILREDVESVSRKQEELSRRGIELEIHDLEWGKIGIIFDPDGNKLEYFRKK